jgi:hypothetical protein
MREILGAKATNEEGAQGHQCARTRQTVHCALDTSPNLIAVNLRKVHKRIMRIQVLSATTDYNDGYKTP